MVTAYSQRDTQWSEEGLGHQKTPTMGAAGCLVTSVASVITDLTDQPFGPGYLNDWLRQNKGYASGNLFIFASVVPLGLQLAELVRTQSQLAPIERLAEMLDDGAAVIVQVDFSPGGDLNTHWVRLLSVDEKDGQIMDPWQMPGKEFMRLSAYFASGWTPARAIFTSAIYRPKAAPVRGLYGLEASIGLANLGTDGDESPAYQPALCIRPDQE